jgi:hypothetical protein
VSRFSYQVSANLNGCPHPAKLDDVDFKELLSSTDTRQMLHVGYGEVLSLRDFSGDFALRNALKSCLIEHKEDYDKALELHIGRHLSLLSKSK